jgi:MerR family copper efflux transcriptional regulator
MNDMTIGKVAKATGVPAKTIRYYEDVGLLPPAERADNGYRVYSETALQLLRFVKRGRDLGFSTGEVAGLLALWQDDSRSSADVRAVAEQHVADIERKIEELEAMRRTLLELMHRCHGDDRPDCPILDDLADGPKE